jgi:hypothetical protein
MAEGCSLPFWANESANPIFTTRLGRKLPQILPAAADPENRLLLRLIGRLPFIHYGTYAIVGLEIQVVVFVAAESLGIGTTT